MSQQAKTCIACGEFKPLTQYYKNASSLDGHIGTCKACKAKQQRERRARKSNAERYKKEAARRRANHLRANYGIEEETYRKMYEEQHGVCAICKQPESIEGRSLCVDHSHITGEVRGLLCSNCNRGIGLLKDSPELVRNAFHYLTGKL
ncbi:endonuclease VII [Escherichia phage HZP2]|uniref:Recombination endonuclease VII n=1 Tax=Escherichia phage HZP2 TaxID=2530019 RepID=A0A481V871_9CAUD|nr:endonuclease VII [Escherichia phage HZP2]QBI89974.1 hypothetical protein HZP2_10 [Escherichia phage HZP2]